MCGSGSRPDPPRPTAERKISSVERSKARESRPRVGTSSHRHLSRPRLLLAGVTPAAPRWIQVATPPPPPHLLLNLISFPFPFSSSSIVLLLGFHARRRLLLPHWPQLPRVLPGASTFHPFSFVETLVPMLDLLSPRSVGGVPEGEAPQPSPQED